jgi:hypothetical protein
MDCVLCHGDDICLIFDLEFERTSLQAVCDEIALHTGRLVPDAFHLDDERMNFMMLTIVGNNVNNRSGIRVDKNLFFEGSLSHEVIIL